MDSSSLKPESGAFSRLTFAVPDHLRLEAEAVARARDRSLAQLARRGLRLALDEAQAEMVVTTRANGREPA